MNSELRKRKKQFMALFLAFLMAVMTLQPLGAFATYYSYDSGNNITEKTQYHSGDTISIASGTLTVDYYDLDDNAIETGQKNGTIKT